MTRVMVLTSAAILAASTNGAGQQTITLPPDGDNQRSQVIQQIGIVRATIEYSSPDVHGPNGDDRRGKIWGTLVPWGIHDLGFNSRKGPSSSRRTRRPGEASATTRARTRSA
jgi:hypothetical protein